MIGGLLAGLAFGGLGRGNSVFWSFVQLRGRSSRHFRLVVSGFGWENVGRFPSVDEFQQMLNGKHFYGLPFQAMGKPVTTSRDSKQRRSIEQTS